MDHNLAEVINHPGNFALKTRLNRYLALRNGYEAKFAQALKQSIDVEISRIEMLKACVILAKEYLGKSRFYEEKYHGLLYATSRLNISDK